MNAIILVLVLFGAILEVAVLGLVILTTRRVPAPPAHAPVYPAEAALEALRFQTEELSIEALLQLGRRLGEFVSQVQVDVIGVTNVTPAPAATPVSITPELENSIRVCMETRRNSYLASLAS